MCGRYALDYDSEELPAALGQWGIHASVARDQDSSSNSTNHPPSYNVAPTQRSAVYNPTREKGTGKGSETATEKDQDKGTGDIRYMKWGLLPHWSRKPGAFTGYSTFNARLEKLLGSKMWSGCLPSRRCAVPMSGYYEWLTAKDKSKTPYYLRRKDDRVMFLAGLFDYNETENLYTFTIVTGPAPTNLAWLHDRMPCVLEADSPEWEQWMDPGKTRWTQGDLDRVLMPRFDEQKYQVYRVSRDVGRVANNGIYLTQEVKAEVKSESLRAEGALDSKHPVKKEGAGGHPGKKRSIIDMMKQSSAKRKEAAPMKKSKTSPVKKEE